MYQAAGWTFTISSDPQYRGDLEPWVNSGMRFMIFEPGEETILFYASSRYLLSPSGERSGPPQMTFEVYWPGILRIDHRAKSAEYGPLRAGAFATKNLPFEETVINLLDARNEQLIYFMQVGNGPIKIGTSCNVSQRLNNFQTASPSPVRLLATLPGGHSIERHIHRRFSHAHIRGEWFDPVDELIEFIAHAQAGNRKG